MELEVELRRESSNYIYQSLIWQRRRENKGVLINRSCSFVSEGCSRSITSWRTALALLAQTQRRELYGKGFIQQQAGSGGWSAGDDFLVLKYIVKY